MTEIAQCPACWQTREATIQHRQIDEAVAHRVECVCGTSGPWMGTVSSAFAAWGLLSQLCEAERQRQEMFARCNGQETEYPYWNTAGF